MLVLVRFVLLLVSVALLVSALVSSALGGLGGDALVHTFLFVLCNVGIGVAHDVATCTVAVGPDAAAPRSSLATAHDEEAPISPIWDYNDLTIAEILPLLKELYDDELEVVEAHERSTRDRPGVITAIADIRACLASSEGDLTFSEWTAMGSAMGDDTVSRPVPGGRGSRVVGEGITPRFRRRAS